MLEPGWLSPDGGGGGDAGGAGGVDGGGGIDMERLAFFVSDMFSVRP